MAEPVTEAAPRLVLAVMSAALIGEIIIFGIAATGRFASVLVLGAHLMLVGIMSLVLWRPLRSGSDGGVALLGVLSTLATGPFGAAGTLLLPTLGASGTESTTRLAAWYQRIALSADQDEFTRVSDRIVIGRTANLAAVTPAELAVTFASGATTAQQTALGMIARNFHPAYLPALKIALDSPEPVIRVQAAAVAARVRETLKRDIGPMLARAAVPQLTPHDALALAGDLDVSAASGLLEDAARASALRASTGLRARTFARIDANARDPHQGHPVLATTEVADAYLTHLLETGRIVDFRAARARTRFPVSGRYRRRRVVLTTRAMAGARFKRGATRPPAGAHS